MPVAAYSSSAFLALLAAAPALCSCGAAGADRSLASFEASVIGMEVRSLKKTAEITPRLAVFPSACPYERSSVVNSKRRASVRLVCHPLMVTVS